MHSFYKASNMRYNIEQNQIGGNILSKIRLTEQQEKRKHWLIERMNDYQEIDEPLVDALAFAIDQLEFMDAQVNEVKSLLSDKTFMTSREKIVRQVESGLKMLDITPQARNKAKVEAAKVSDPLVELLGDI